MISITLSLGVVDYFTGPEISFAVFYLVPVMLSAWSISTRGGLFVSLLSASVWITANYLAGEQLSGPAIYVWNALTRAGFFIIVTFLLTEVHHQLQSERILAQLDPLTNIFNRRAFYQLLNFEISRLQRHHHPFSVVYIDLDNFKSINDRFGHSTGDKLLKEVAVLLKSYIRMIDVVARIGGDEFVILLPETDQKAVKGFIPRLQRGLMHEMVKNHWDITLSIGVLTCTQPPESVDRVISRVDQLMYSVKVKTKNAVMYDVDQTS